MPLVKEYLEYFEKLGVSIDERYHGLDMEKGYDSLVPRLELLGKGRAVDILTKKEYHIGPGGMKIGLVFHPFIREAPKIERPAKKSLIEKLSSMF